MVGKIYLIIIPAHNEEQSIKKTLQCLRSVQADIMVINDGSRDKTASIVQQCQKENDRLELISLPLNCGIGAAMQAGFLYAKENDYDYAIQHDGDGQHCAEDIEPMLNHAIENNLDLCIGSRFLNITSFSSTRMRRVGIRFFVKLIGILSGITVTDPTSGCRVYGRRAIDRFANYYPDDYPEPESLFWCSRNGLIIGELPVTMYERQGGESSIRYMKTAYYMFKVSMAILIDRIRVKEVENA